MKRIKLLIISFFVALCVCAQSTVKHEIQPGETFYSIARAYGISAQELKALNPAIEPDHIMAGQKLSVPASKAAKPDSVRPKFKCTHEVKKKETVFSISQLYGISQDQLRAANPSIKKDKLKKGSVLNIPYSDADNLAFESEKKHKEEVKRQEAQKKYGAVRVAVILPFSLSSATVSAEAQKMVDFYRGMLLAVDSLKSQGTSVELYVYDETSEAVSSILARPMMKNMQLIVGPARNENIGMVAEHAHKHGITHVVPFSSSLVAVESHPTTFQVNVPHSLLYPSVYNRFIASHSQDNIIFVGMSDKGNNINYIEDFKRALSSRSVPFSTVSIREFSKILNLVKSDTRNVIIPSSGSAQAFNTLCNRLNSLHFGDHTQLSLFGYPEWQLYGQSEKSKTSMAKYRSQFFTPFYVNKYAQRTINFNNKFRRWFRGEQFASVPRYGELGFDVGYYFISGVKKYGKGKAFADNLGNISYQSIEFPFRFERKNDWSGFQNKAIRIITYDAEGRITAN